MQFTKSRELSFEERAFMSRLIALNAAIDAAQAGKPGQSWAHAAQSSNALLENLLREIKSSSHS